MSEKKQESAVMGRRDFLKSLARWGLFSGLALLAGKLMIRKNPGSKTDENCINRFLCRGCGKAELCLLPQAQSYRKLR